MGADRFLQNHPLSGTDAVFLGLPRLKTAILMAHFLDYLFMNAETLCLLAAGVFFLNGLLTGLWKYLCMARSADASSPVYVDIAHRASLMYAFSALLLKEFVPYSPLAAWGTLLAVAGPLLFFALSIAIYMVHGLLRDTDNQLRKPHKLGSHTLPALMIQVFMLSLAVVEIGGFAVLLYGFLRAL